ncbi:hypothetical protein DaAHT2_1844 [Desulfurivibrio alkaliphilus AHT 2]|uniref:Glycosyl hydrolase family 32 N-terminal domain-containing protein n=2 Tax=Desulfurivibrio alkaliphilus TaxID=427923 RepID=D6Z4Q0_DESAT|nr:hypothetical protein DaAHT2_1844 [Desulfurivibrio alkaliphilus AHT 2]
MINRWQLRLSWFRTKFRKSMPDDKVWRSYFFCNLRFSAQLLNLFEDVVYFYGPAKARSGQRTGFAYSEDGIHFRAMPDLLGKFYFRVWQWQDHWYALAKNNNEGWGELYRGPHPDGPFELRGNFLKNMRHAAVLVEGHWLRIFYSRVGDAPERILMASVDMREDWLHWRPTEPVEVIRPSEGYEGIAYPVAPSEHGAAVGVHQLRDPFVMAKKYGEWWCFYSVCGEHGICGAAVVI